jgi:hypothetical protein
MLPEDTIGAGGTATALAAYFFGESGGMKSAERIDPEHFRMELVAREDAVDVDVRFETSADLTDWSVAEEVSLVSATGFSEDFEKSVWELDIPQGASKGFARAVFVLK